MSKPTTEDLKTGLIEEPIAEKVTLNATEDKVALHTPEDAPDESAPDESATEKTETSLL